MFQKLSTKSSSMPLLLAGLFLCVCILFTPVVAFAHASVIKSNPMPGSTITSPPHEVQIWFDEAVQASFYGIEVTDEHGKRIDIGDGHLAPNNHALLECTLTSGLGNGYYLTHWHAVSDDGHHVSGTIPFSIGSVVQNMKVPAVSQSSHAFPPFLVVANRWIQYIGFILLSGLFVFASLILDKPMRKRSNVAETMQKITWILLTLLSLSIALSLPIQTSVDAGKPLSGIWHASLIKMVLATRFGQVFIWQVALAVLLVIGAVGMQFAKKQGRHHFYLPLAILSFGLLVSKSLTSHAASSSYPVYTIVADCFHLAAASIWLGSLVGMAFLLPVARGTKEPSQMQSYWLTIRRFSIWGIVTVLVLVATGLFATFMNIPDLYTLFHTRYGQTLVAKLALFIIMLVLALFHLVKGQKQNAEKPITRTVRTELGFGLAILLVTAVLTNLPTARLTPGPYANTQSLPDGSSITLQVTPNVAGVNAINVFLKTSTGTALSSVDKASISLTSLDHDTGTNTYPIRIGANGQAKLVGLYLSTAGKWYVTVHVLVNKENDEYAHFQFEVGSPS